MIGAMAFIGLVLCADNTNLLENGNFQQVIQGKPAVWRLGGGDGRLLPTGGADQGPCVTVYRDKAGVNWWRQTVPLEGGRLYSFSFDCKLIRGGGSGCVVSGPLGMNRDFKAGDTWKQCRFTFPVPAGQGGEKIIRLGTWEMDGEVAFDNVRLVPVQMFHKKLPGGKLGEGEKVHGRQYHFRAPLGGGLSAYSRPLEDFRCDFNSQRWCFGRDQYVLYRHEVGDETYQAGSVKVHIGYYTGGELLVQARRPEGAWQPVGRLSALEAKTFKLPEALFPAKRVLVRLVREDEKIGTFQVYGYEFEGTLARDTGLLTTGATQALMPDIMDRTVSVTVDRMGDLLPGGDNQLALTVEGPAGFEGVLKLLLSRQGEAVAASDGVRSEKVILSKGGTSRFTLPYAIREAGDQVLTLQVDDSKGKTVYKAGLPFSVPPLFAADYGWRVPVDAGKTLGLWWCTATEKIGRKRPMPADGKAVTLSVAGNEEEACQLVLRPDRDLRDVSVLFQPRGKSLKKMAVKTRVREVGYVMIKVPTDYSGCTGEWPDPLVPHEKPVTIPAGTNQPFWLSVKTGKNVPPGEYDLAAVISEAGRVVCEVPVKLRVYGFTLPDKHSIRTAFGFSSHLAARYHNVTSLEDKRKLFDLYMQNFRDHRISPYDFAPFDPIKVSFPKDPASGKVVLDFSGWDREAARYLDGYHFDGFRLRLQGLGGGTFHSRAWGAIGTHRQGTAAYRALFKEYASQVEAHLREKGWLDKAYIYWFDEPAPKDYDFVKAGMEEIKLAAPGLTRMLTEEPNDHLAGSVDVWCPVLQNAAPEKIQARIQAGEEVWWYVCCSPKAPYLGLFIDHPATDLRAWLWLSWKWSVTGILVWQSNYWTSSCAFPKGLQDPWADPMSYQTGYGRPPGYIGYWGNGDGRFIYPPAGLKGKVMRGPVDTIRWEMLREGIEDYEYLAMLKRRIEKAGAGQDGLKQAKELLKVPDAIIQDGRHYAKKAAPIMARRRAVARAIEGLSSAGGNWAQWRGPHFNGSSDEEGLPATWDETRNVAWVKPMPGVSGATPIVWKDRVFISTVDDRTDDLLALCYRVSDGRELWRCVTGKNRKVPINNMTSCSPSTDGKRVYFTYGTGDIIAFDMAGKKLWAENFCNEAEMFSLQFGYSSTPLLHQGRLYVPVIQNSNPQRYRHLRITREKAMTSFLLILDAATGKTLSRTARPSDADDESLEAYTSPIPYTWQGRQEILLYGGDCLTGHDPDSGKELWRWGGFNLRNNPRWRVVPSPLTCKGLIYVSAPKHDPFYAVKAGATGKVGMSRVAWSLAVNSPDAAMPLLYRDRLYVLNDDRKIMSCLVPETGRVIWQERLPAKTVFRAGITGADGKIYCMDESGLVFVLKAGDDFKLLHQMAMGRRPSRSQIVAAAGRLFIRTADKLYCLKKGKG